MRKVNLFHVNEGVQIIIRFQRVEIEFNDVFRNNMWFSIPNPRECIPTIINAPHAIIIVVKFDAYVRN